MATRDGQQVDAVESHGGAVVKATNPLCVACGRYHGSTNAELNCLRSHVLEQRKIIAWLRGT